MDFNKVTTVLHALLASVSACSVKLIKHVLAIEAKFDSIKDLSSLKTLNWTRPVLSVTQLSVC